jgi:hypothetical protein
MLTEPDSIMEEIRRHLPDHSADRKHGNELIDQIREKFLNAVFGQDVGSDNDNLVIVGRKKNDDEQKLDDDILRIRFKQKRPNEWEYNIVRAKRSAGKSPPASMAQSCTEDQMWDVVGGFLK